MRTARLALIAFLLSLGTLARAQTAFRPPAVPLIAHDPYFSVWSITDRLPDDWPRHWTGKNQALCAMARIDGKAYRLMGRPQGDPAPMTQTALEVLPTRTAYTFTAPGVQIALTFLTPALPDDLDVYARPVTYLVWETRATDGAEHKVSLYLDACGELVTNTPDQKVVWSRHQMGGLDVLRMGSQDQPVLQTAGDDRRIDWGYLYLAVPSGPGVSEVTAGSDAVRAAFMSTGKLPEDDDLRMPRAANDDWPILAAVMDLGSVGASPVSRHALVAFDDVYSLEFMQRRLRPYWRRNGTDVGKMLRAAERDFPALSARCRDFDTQLMADLERSGGPAYARLCALAFRQTAAGNKLAADWDGTPILMPKENFSNGCIDTVDVVYPSAPFFLAFNPELLEAEIRPLMEYADSPRWKFPFAPHDLGTYPLANGQVYGGGERTEENQMPVEECGNMLIMLGALTRPGDTELAARYWPVLTRWADYLAANGLDPENQLCTADMFGHMAHNADLSLKAIIGLGAYAKMARALGMEDVARKYMALAREDAAKWQQMAKDDGYTRLAFDKPGTWGMKHNLVWDRVLGLKLFPDSVGDAEVAHYLKVQGKYGLPCDTRTRTSLIDWALWCAALARDKQDFEALVAPLYRYADETPSRVPLSDWFNVDDARQVGFQARPVVGGLFMRLLLDRTPEIGQTR